MRDSRRCEFGGGGRRRSGPNCAWTKAVSFAPSNLFDYRFPPLCFFCFFFGVILVVSLHVFLDSPVLIMPTYVQIFRKFPPSRLGSDREVFQSHRVNMEYKLFKVGTLQGLTFLPFFRLLFTSNSKSAIASVRSIVTTHSRRATRKTKASCLSIQLRDPIPTTTSRVRAASSLTY